MIRLHTSILLLCALLGTGFGSERASSRSHSLREVVNDLNKLAVQDLRPEGSKIVRRVRVLSATRKHLRFLEIGDGPKTTVTIDWRNVESIHCHPLDKGSRDYVLGFKLYHPQPWSIDVYWMLISSQKSASKLAYTIQTAVNEFGKPKSHNPIFDKV